MICDQITKCEKAVNNFVYGWEARGFENNLSSIIRAGVKLEPWNWIEQTFGKRRKKLHNFKKDFNFYLHVISGIF